MALHPKVAAAGAAATVLTIVTAVLALTGVSLDDRTSEAIAVIVAALVPVVAGYLKSSNGPVV